MQNFKKYIPIVLRVSVAFLFLFSAYAKIDPSPTVKAAISNFELTYLCSLMEMAYAQIISRALIAAEIALGIAILFPFYVKRFVIPVSAFLLFIFSIHLSYVIFSSGNSGNCGCFGELVSMTPLQAIIKNVLAIFALIYLYFITPKDNIIKSHKYILALFYIVPVLIMFLLFPFSLGDSSPCEKSSIKEVKVTDFVKGPPQKSSKFSEYIGKVDFETGGKTFNIDEGRKILCFYNPECDHCMDAAKAINKMEKSIKNFPEVFIIFQEEGADKIPDFFSSVGKSYRYKIMNAFAQPFDFYKVFPAQYSTPGVLFLWNGNVIRLMEGINENKFTPEKLEKALKKK